MDKCDSAVFTSMVRDLPNFSSLSGVSGKALELAKYQDKLLGLSFEKVESLKTLLCRVEEIMAKVKKRYMRTYFCFHSQ